MAIPRSFPRAASFAAILHLFERFDELWQRKRVWGTMQGLLTIFALVEPGRASSYQLACKTAYGWASKRFGWVSEPDPSGFNRARNRVKEEECVHLLAAATSMAQDHMRRVKRLVCGLLPVAVDGSILHMPRSQELRREFGVPTNKLGVEKCHYPQAMLVTAWDLVRRIPIAWALGSHTVGEREVLLGMLDQLAKNALLILDRGYPSDIVLGKIRESGRHFVVRMVASDGAGWKEIRDFLASGKRDAVVPVEVGTGPTRRTIRLRMILRTFDRGRPNKHQSRKTMVLMTSVLDKSLSARDICRLYGQRWGIETIFREMKAVAKIEQWHGHSVKLVRQEVILLLVWFCFAAIFAATAEALHPKNGSSGILWRANTRRVFEAIAVTIDALIAVTIKSPGAADLISRADSAIRAVCRWLLKRRHGRSFARAPLHPYARLLTRNG
jgi:hypothetical protein